MRAWKYMRFMCASEYLGVHFISVSVQSCLCVYVCEPAICGFWSVPAVQGVSVKECTLVMLVE